MSAYIRPHAPGASVFFTVCLAVRGSHLLIDHVELLRESVMKTRAEHPFEIQAWVVLPDHLHAVWRLPAGDTRHGVRWGAIKSRFSRAILRKHGWPRSALDVCRQSGALKRTLRTSHQKRRELGIWQRRFWEHHCRNEADLSDHIRYCWANPVKHGLVGHPAQWAASSIHRDTKLGLVPKEWSAKALVEVGEP